MDGYKGLSWIFLDNNFSQTIDTSFHYQSSVYKYFLPTVSRIHNYYKPVCLHVQKSWKYLQTSLVLYRSTSYVQKCQFLQQQRNSGNAAVHSLSQIIYTQNMIKFTFMSEIYTKLLLYILEFVPLSNNNDNDHQLPRFYCTSTSHKIKMLFYLTRLQILNI